MMLSLAEVEVQSKSNPRKERLLDSAAQRGYGRGQVEQCLGNGLVWSNRHPDSRGNTHWNVSCLHNPAVGRACDIQFQAGPDGLQAGCVSCTEAQSNGRYNPHLVQDCPAVMAAVIEYILTQPQQQPEAPAEPKPEQSLLDLALAEFKQRSQWSSSDTITIWESGNKAAWLSRNTQGFITLQLFKNAQKLNQRRYSRPLTIGYWSPNDKMYVECHELRDNYPRWSEQAKREVA